MKQTWSASWNSSIKPNKQRKYRYAAPLHIQHAFLGAHLSSELRKKYKIRSLPLRKGDTVRVMRGQYKKKTGKITKILTRKQKAYIEGIDRTKKDGNKTFIPFHPSKLLITGLDLTDKKRKAKIEEKTTKEKK